MRRFGLAGLVTAMFLVAGGGAGASHDVVGSGSQWVVTDLGGGAVAVSDINDRGQVVGGIRTKSDGSRVLVWKNGKMRLLWRGRYAGASAINERGQIVGTSTFADGTQHAVLWENGTMTRIGPASSLDAMAINNRGQVIGHYAVPDKNDDNSLMTVSFIWEQGEWQGPLFEPEDPRAGPGNVYGINNRGQVIGASDGRALLWESGTITDLGPGTPTDINDRGQIVGMDQGGHAFLWENGRTTDLGHGWPIAINERGQVIGVRNSTDITRGPRGHGVVWQNGTKTDLGTLGGKWSIPTAISNRGQIIGYSSGKRGLQQAFLWQGGTMTRLGPPRPGARTWAKALNERNQIIGDNACDCRELSKFAVIWTLKRG